MSNTMQAGLALIAGGLLVNIPAWGFWAWTRTWEIDHAAHSHKENLMAGLLTIGLFVPLPIIAIGVFMVIYEFFQWLMRKRV